MKAYPLLPGEHPMPGAPDVAISARERCIPQHFLRYQHTLETVENLMSEVQCDPHFPVFVGQNNSGIYLQVGIIGYDNYKPIASQSGMKITYGRKWRIEPTLPSSEILQTAFLAISKAREHEVRERFVVKDATSTTTPFNNHHDFPLMSRLEARLSRPLKRKAVWNDVQVTSLLSKLRYDHAQIELIALTPHRRGWLVDLRLRPGVHTSLPEINNEVFTLVLAEADSNALLFSLMDHFLSISHRHVEETFSFKGFRRFSRQIDVLQISHLSRLTRSEQAQHRSSDFEEVFRKCNEAVDKSRVPGVVDAYHRQRLIKALSHHTIVDGFLP